MAVVKTIQPEYDAILATSATILTLSRQSAALVIKSRQKLV